MDTLPFSSKDYSKHDFQIFPTIRRRDKYGVIGTVVSVEAGPQGEREEIGKAEIIAKEEVTLGSLPTAFLLHDTESTTREEAEESLQSFYRNPIEEDEALTLYWLAWVEGGALDE